MIVRVSVVLRRTVCGGINRLFDNKSGSHRQSQMNCESSVMVSLRSLSWVDGLAVL